MNTAFKSLLVGLLAFSWLFILPTFDQCYAATPMVANGDNYSLILKSDGSVWSWGRNTSGQLGDGTTTDRDDPIQVAGLSDVVAIDACASTSMALKGDGTVWAWGNNFKCQLGIGVCGFNEDRRLVPVQVIGLSGIVAISLKNEYQFALKSDGTVWAWGYNPDGILGVEDFHRYVHTPDQVVGLSDVVEIASSDSRSYAIKSDGTVWAWGENGWGGLGDGTNTRHSHPVQLPILSGVVAIEPYRNATLALKSDGSVWGWGFVDSCYDLGDTTKVDPYTPVQIMGLSDVVSLSLGISHVTALKNDGSVWWWDSNFGPIKVENFSVSQFSTEAPQAPTLFNSTNGDNVKVYWSPKFDATGYTLYYAPYPFTGIESIGSFDMGQVTEGEFTLWGGASFYIAIEAYNDSGASGYSNIGLFTIQ